MATRAEVSPITQDICEQLISAYAKVVNGSFTQEEAKEFVDAWWKQEDCGRYEAGCCHHAFRPAAVFAFEAVRSLNTGVDGKKDAVRLLKLALKELE
jgi:hypothetical protein